MASQRCSLCGVNYPPGYGECLRCGGVLRYCVDPPADDWRDAPAVDASNESARVEMWRLRMLLEAGYPVALAERLAAADVDLHRAIELVRRGCAPVLAAEILL